MKSTIPRASFHRCLSSQLVPQNDSESTLPSKLIDFSVSAKIEGEESQIAIVKLLPGETLRAESGAMLYMTKGVEMATSLQSASTAFSRMMTGQNVFLTEFTYTEDKEGQVGLGTDFPSKIIRISLQDYGGSIIAQRGAYLASNPSVDIQMEFTKKFSTGFFGGQGFILQRLSGEGDVLVKAGGTLVERELADGEILRVTSGSIVAFESFVEYDIQMMPGIKNAMFGGEGLFVTSLTGPGKIWLQGMPPDRMIAEIASRVPAGSGFGPVIPLGGSGGSGGERSGDSGGAVDGATGDVGAAGMTGGAAAAGNEMPGENVAATDDAINADRQATVASSGMMGDDDSTGAEFPGTVSTDSITTDSSSNSGYQETTFTDDGTTYSSSNEPNFDDGSSFSTTNDDSFGQQQLDDSFGDSGETEIFDTGGAEDAAEAAGSTASSIFSTLWDFFTGDE
ncbi:TIGR00266 family protein [Nitzschia inconspicua]|uniref:TIGR00266 family protein n=1 Tax=Nitzschia inconspicua TaxID=303405 RepID=A0A9K3PYZ8_9STRA|nr:TIGR00266 family protein [Nitzschia inconspicua]